MSLPPATQSDLPPSPFFDSGAPPANTIEARIIELRAEADATEDPTRRAGLLYEAGQLTERGLKNPAHAVPVYLEAFNLDHGFRLPLFALLRLFERRRSTKNLPRLYQAQLKSARTERERAEALVDLAVLSTLHDRDLERARKHLEDAVAADPSNQSAALLLEAHCRAAGDPDSAVDAVSRRAEYCDDPMTKGLLLLELASWQQAHGDLEGALASLKAAAAQPGDDDDFLVALARFCRAQQRVPELVEATRRQAELATRRFREAGGDAGGREAELFRARAVALWYEASRLYSTRLSDARGALKCLDEASALRPDDVLLRQTRMSAYDLLEDRRSAAEQAQALLDLGVEGEHAASLHFRLAELALVEGDADQAREQLQRAIAQTGGSAAADAMLDDLLLDEGRHEERVALLTARAEREGSGDRASWWSLQAALVCAYELGDDERAAALFERAVEQASAPEAATREAYAHALRCADDERAARALARLLASSSLEEDERAALLHHAVEVATGEARRALMTEHLGDSAAAGWLAHQARVEGARAADWALLARAHEALVEQAPGQEDAVAHLCAAARAKLRGEDPQGAVELLKQALTKAPAQRYALTLLEETLRQSGETDEVVALLRRSAEAQAGARDAELGLLLAGAAAEGCDDLEAAADAYQEAAERNPGSPGPLWALLRLSQRSADPALERRAREGLARRERDEGDAGPETLLLAEHYDLISDEPELSAEPLHAALAEEVVGVHAAASLSLLRGASSSQRRDAVRRLAEASDEESPVLWRELTAQLLADKSDPDTLLEAAERTLSARADDRLAHWAKACVLHEGGARERADRLKALADATVDDDLAAALRAAALRARRSPSATDEDAQPESADVALEASGWARAETVPASAARLLLDALGPGEAPALRAQALEAAADATELSAEDTLALARARLARGDAQGAVTLLKTHLAQERQADDLAAWETLRVAARRAGRWEDVAEACDRLAAQLDGELQAQLLEEGAAVRMDFLDDDAGAEQRLRRVLEAHPRRRLAYDRLHDLLSEREHTDELLSLVQGRAVHEDHPEELTKLFYELARLHRARGELDAALDALDNLLMLESDHVGGLALAAEIHSAKHNWALAVEALQGLAASDVPRAQRRLARLGAADFLENKLGDPERALAELRTLTDEGHADAQLYTRIADLCERAGRLKQCAEALAEAAQQSPAPKRVQLLLRAARLQADKLDDPRAAADSYRAVLSLEPDHLEACTALARLTPAGEARERAIAAFEDAVRERLAERPLDAAALRKLGAAGQLREDADLYYVSAAALTALGQENAAETRAVAAARKGGPRVPRGRLTPRDWAPLLATPDERWRQIGEAVFRAGYELDQLEPSKLGVGRAQRVSPKAPHALREDALPLVLASGRELGDFYVGGDNSGRVIAFPKGDTTCLVMGDSVTPPLDAERRYQLALQVAAVALQTHPLLTRTPAQGARLLHAALLGVGAPLPEGVDARALGQLSKNVYKAMARRDRKLVQGLRGPLGADDAERHCTLMARNTRRLALLLSGDLTVALEHLLGRVPSHEHIADCADAVDLVSAWTSRAMLQLRSKLGIAL